MDLAAIALAALAEFPSTPVVIFDAEGRCVAVFGKRLPDEGTVLGREAIVGRLPEEYMGDEAAEFRRTLALVLASGESALLRSRVTRPNNDLTFEVSLWPLVDAKLVACVIRNVSETDRLRRERDATESRMQAIVEHTAPFLFELAADGTIVFVGSPPREFTVDPASLMGTNVRDIAQHTPGLHPDDVPLVAASLRQFVESPDGWSHPLARVRGRDGRVRTFETSGGWYPGPDGQRRGLLVFREVLARPEADIRPGASEPATSGETLESLQRNNLVLLAGGVAHDFNNLLAISLGVADLIAEQLPDASPIRPYLAEIVTASRQAADLSRQLLAATGKAVSASLVPIELNDVIRSQESLLRTGVPKSVKLEYAPCDGHLWVNGDATQLRQVVLNLVTNAGEAIGEKRGTIRVATGRAGELERGPQPLRDRALIEVSDDGPGFDETVIARIFEPSFSTKTRGSGLGLAVVDNVVRRHGGRIQVTSANHRTTFRIELPLLPDRELEAKSTFASNLAQARYSDVGVLIVDDDDGVRRVCASMLGVAKFRVFEAPGAETALALVEREPAIACAVVDLIMPDSDGLALIDALRKKRPGLRVVLCSGALNRIPDDRSDLVVLEKPFRYGELIEAVWRALEARP